MLFWAVDNPAPANYLLISGDRDFSNALHQLRMRRYNILLAQPLKASAALVAAAKSVWLWTSLIAGGSPLTSGESSQFVSCSNKTVNPEMYRAPVPDTTSVVNLPSYSKFETLLLPLGNQNLFNPGWVGDIKSKGKYVQKNLQPSITRTSSMPVGVQASNTKNYSNQPEHTPANQFKRAPHEFFGPCTPVISASRSAPNFFTGNPDPSGNNANTNFIDIPHNEYNQPRPAFAPDNLPRVNSHNITYHQMPSEPDGPSFPSAPFTNPPDIGWLSIREQTNYSRNPPNFKNGIGEESKSKLVDSSNIAIPYVSQRGDISHMTHPFYHDTPENRYRPPEYSTLPSSSSNNVFSRKGIQGIQECQPSSEYIQGLIGIILLALNTLKLEKIMPTEANITDCIRYGDPKYRNTDIKQALNFALEQQMVVQHDLGEVPLYIGRMERLWKCVNPSGVNHNQYPKATWDAIQIFLTSSAGCSAIMASECR